jgi:fido (protein-threonine AMPylation protein)
LAEENYLKGLDASTFSARAAFYLGGLNALHPFRDGNGRAQREFINHLAFKNGYFIDWANISPDDLIQASIESFHRGDHSKFASLIHDNPRELSQSE